MPTPTDAIYLSAIARIDAYSPNAVHRLLRRLGSARAIWQADETALVQIGGARPESTGTFLDRRRAADPILEQIRLDQTGSVAIPIDDPRFPSLLKQIPDPPFILFVRGDPAALSHAPALAVVGTRKITRYGQAAVEKICRPLAQAGVAVVSGLAYGVDAAAHRTALEAGGLTVAVLGGGIDHDTIHPRINAPLAEEIIAKGGAVVSECPAGVQPHKYSFPRRNRIIAGLAKGTIIVEAAEKSGALITAECALDYNRDVWAVPGPITQNLSAGTNKLLTAGALPAISAEHILNHYGLLDGLNPASATETTGLNPTEQKILLILGQEPASINHLIEQTEESARETMAALTALEISGRVTRYGDLYQLKC